MSHSKEYLKAWYQARKDIYKEKYLRKTYNISVQDLFDMLEDQGYLCEICGDDLSIKPPKNIHIDHCHSTKKIRGILCNNCNMSLGLLKEDVEVLRKCINYLERYNGTIAEYEH